MGPESSAPTKAARPRGGSGRFRPDDAPATITTSGRTVGERRNELIRELQAPVESEFGTSKRSFMRQARYLGRS